MFVFVYLKSFIVFSTAFDKEYKKLIFRSHGLIIRMLFIEKPREISAFSVHVYFGDI